MPKQVLKFTPDELSKTAKSYFDKRFVQEDFKSYWCSIEFILEEIADEETIFKSVSLPKGFNWKKKLTLEDIPKEWWKVMAFPPKVERAMKAFWKKHPNGDVEWKW